MENIERQGQTDTSSGEDSTPDVRYIKLGKGGCWERTCLLEDNTLRLGYESDQHQACLNRDWEAVRLAWRDIRDGSARTASWDVNQIRMFYEEPESTIWITFHGGRMYWCRAHSEVRERVDKTRERQTIGRWSSVDAHGEPLRISELDGRLTKVKAYQGTICGVEVPEYVLRRIGGIPEPEVQMAKAAKARLQDAVTDLIGGLWWGDFELLVDLIFMNAGWRRVSRLGEDQKSLDLDLFSPATRRRAFVQVKSNASAATLQECVNQFEEHEHDEMYFVCHSYVGDEIPESTRPVYLWGRTQLAELVCDLGLTSWLINKRR